MASKDQKLNAQIRIGATQERSVGVAMGAVQRKLSGLGDEIKTVTKRQKEIASEREAFKKQGRSVEALDREYEALGETLSDLQRKQERWERAVKAGRRVGDSMRNTMAGIGRTARTGGIAIGGAAAGIVGLASTTASSVEQINASARRLNMDPESLSKFNFVAAQFGVQSEAAVDALKELQIRSDEFAETGKGGGADAFARLGLSREDVKAARGDAEQLFEMVQTRIAKVQDAAARQRIADEILGGQGGEQLIEVLTLSQTEMGKLLKEAERVGAGVTNAQTKTSRAFTRQQQKLGAAFDATRRNVATELMPVVGDAMQQVSDYMIENRDEIGKFAEKFADGLERAIPIVGQILQGIGKVGGALIDGAEKLKEWSGSWENAGKIIGAAVLAPTAFRIGSMLISMGRLGAALVGLGPSMKDVGAGFRALKRVVVAQVGAAAAATEAAGRRMRKAFKFGGLLGKVMRIGGGAAVLSVMPTALADGTLKGGEAPKVGQDDIDAEAERARRDQGSDETGWLGRTMQDWGIMTKPKERAIGGAFSAGRGLIVGERGPEAMFPSQGGYIATNRAVENMAGMIERIRDGATGMAQQAAGAASNVTIHAPIDARGMDANELKHALEDLHRRASQGALFDHPADFGQYV